MNIDLNIFAKRLKHCRQKSNLTQAKLARIINSKQNVISAYETLKSEPDLETIKNLAIFFNVSADYLLGLSNSIISQNNPYLILINAYYDELMLLIDEYITQYKVSGIFDPNGLFSSFIEKRHFS